VAKRSAGLLVYRRRGSGLEIFLVHTGGPCLLVALRYHED